MAYRFVSTRNDWYPVARWLRMQGLEEVGFTNDLDPVCPYLLDIDAELGTASVRLNRRYESSMLGSLYLKMAVADWRHYRSDARNLRKDAYWLREFLRLVFVPVDIRL